MTDREIAKKIAELMGTDWMQTGALMFPLDRIVGRAGSQLVIFGSVICGEDTVGVYDTSHCRSDTPDINDPATRGVIEGWCRERGVWINWGSVRRSGAAISSTLLAAVRVAAEDDEALLMKEEHGAVRLASEVKE